MMTNYKGGNRLRETFWKGDGELFSFHSAPAEDNQSTRIVQKKVEFQVRASSRKLHTKYHRAHKGSKSWLSLLLYRVNQAASLSRLLGRQLSARLCTDVRLLQFPCCVHYGLLPRFVTYSQSLCMKWKGKYCEMAFSILLPCSAACLLLPPGAQLCSALLSDMKKIQPTPSYIKYRTL